MKTGSVAAGLIALLLTLAGPGAVAPAVSQDVGIDVRVRAWALIDFKKSSSRELWRDAGRDTKVTVRWPKLPEGSRPKAVILRLYEVSRVTGARPWESFALIGGTTATDLRAAARYIELHFTHVELYSVTAEF